MIRFLKNMVAGAALFGSLIILLLGMAMMAGLGFSLAGPKGLAAGLFLSLVLLFAIGNQFHRQIDGFMNSLCAWANR